MNPLIRLVYNSAATCAFSDDELAALLVRARRKNTSLGITGMLLHIDGCFFQALEGPQDAVDRLTEEIRADPRHARMTTIIREPIARRSFGEWTMGFTRLTAADAGRIDGMNDFFGTGHVLTDIDAGRAKKLLLAFRRGRWRVRLATGSAPVARAPAPTPPACAVVVATTPSVPDVSFAYQPIVDVARAAIVSYEALVRGPQREPASWVLGRQQGDALLAFDVEARRAAIVLAERLGLSCDLNLNLLPQGLEAFGPVALQSTLDIARHCGLAPERLVIEISESAVVEDLAGFVRRVQPFKALGLRFAIDDFGAGHAGLKLLAEFQPEFIKLDMSLVQGVDRLGPRQAIVRGIVRTCADLGIDIVAEGVEAITEFEWLRDEGVTLFQGYLFARPGHAMLPGVSFPAVAPAG